MASTVLFQLATWIHSVRHSDVPPRVLALARYQLGNVMASVHAGVGCHESQAVARAYVTRRRAGRCTLIPEGTQVDLETAVFVNGARAMALDYDDYLFLGHTGHSAVLGSLALSEELGRSVQDQLLAQVIANEIGGRIAASTVLGPQNGQAWSYLHAVAAAALASKLMSLTVEQTAHALAIALYQPTYTLWPGFMGPGSKVLTATGPTVTGINATRFAKEGLTGALNIVEHPRKGFWAAFAFVPLPHMLTGLGKSWVTDTLAFKRYPGCAYVDTTLDALLDVLDQIRASDWTGLDSRRRSSRSGRRQLVDGGNG